MVNMKLWAFVGRYNVKPKTKIRRRTEFVKFMCKQQNIINSNQNYYNRSIPFSPSRFFNPWNELANIVPSEELLCDKVESTTRTFGIVAALMGSLAAALLTFNPYDGYDAQRKNEPINEQKKQKTK